jgi:hypothetical protein
MGAILLKEKCLLSSKSLMLNRNHHAGIIYADQRATGDDMTPKQTIKILDGQLTDCYADIEIKTARIAELEASLDAPNRHGYRVGVEVGKASNVARVAELEEALNAARSDALQEAAAICTAVFKESAGYNLPQMALGASKCGDDILALEANT